MIRAVFDTNIFLRALINPHSRCGRLLEEFSDDYQLVLSPAIIREILDVLHRPRLRAKFPQITQLDITHIIGLFKQSHVIEPGKVPPISRNLPDDKFLACAAAVDADYLVTEDKDLLVLETHKGTRICQPAEFITILEMMNAKTK
ncbi:MAG: putative toxin-antitoxin system toxin component, PIN family [Chloroflexota bacterium]